MTETSDSGNYSQYEEGSSENTSETFAQQSSKIINPYQMSDDEDDSDESDDSDYDDSENVKKVDTTSVYNWVRQQIQRGMNPRIIIQNLLHNFDVPEDMSEAMLWRIISLAITPQRDRLENVRSFDDAVHLIKFARNIIILTGAGVSVSCGIPDFRSRDGIYSRLSREYPNLPDPQSMFDIKYFTQDPRPFYKFAREIYPGQFKPSASHLFIKKMEDRGVLLRNYTQNIDTLERIADISRLVECHGSFQYARCTKCRYRISGDDIRDHIFQQRIPLCHICNKNVTTTFHIDENLADETQNSEQLKQLVEMGVFKPEIVFFGEELPDDFHESIDADRHKCDLLIVIGSSLKVKPVAMIPNLIASHIPQILINREPLPHMNFDVNLFGDSDIIVNHISKMIEENNGYEETCDASCLLKEVTVTLPSKKIIEEVAPGNDITENPIPQHDAHSSNIDNLSSLLPSNSYARISPNSRSYIFHGAEVTLDNIDDDDSDISDEFSEGDDMENVASPIQASDENEILSLISPETTANSSFSDKSEISENVNDDDDEDFGPSSIKKPKLDDTTTKNSIL
ncbi:hypothetical protein ACKWTF_012489 [Chironomus riparius]